MSGAKEGSSIKTLLTTPKIVIEGTNDGQPMDKYTAGIELSNACRQFYVTRLKAAGKVKERLGLSNGISAKQETACVDGATCDETKHTCKDGASSPSTRQTKSAESNKRPKNHGKSTIESAMAVLKHEMASLIDQDLALMKQLLTLNEQIEELKWQRKLRGYQVEGSGASSCNIDSNVSVSTISDGEWESRLDQRELPGKYPTPSSLSLYSDYGTSPRASMDRELGRPVSGVGLGGGPGPSKLLQDNTHKLIARESTSDLGSSDELTSSNSELPDNNASGETKTGEQHSFDSGIHDPHRDKNMHRLNVKTYELSL